MLSAKEIVPYCRLDSAALTEDEYIVSLYENRTLALHLDCLRMNMLQNTCIFLSISLAKDCRAHLNSYAVYKLTCCDLGVWTVEHNICTKLFAEIKSKETFELMDPVNCG